MGRKEGTGIAGAASDHFRKSARKWVGQIGAGAVSDGTVTTIPLSSVTGLPTDTGVTVVIDRVDANGTATPALEETVTGLVSGSNLINCIRGAEGTAQGHSAGAVAEVLDTALETNDLMTGLLVGHNQDGTHVLDTDGTLAANSDTKIASQKAIKTFVNANASSTDGWISESHTWTYASADGATGVITIASTDLTGSIQVGDRIKLTQTTKKYFIVTAIAFSTNTTITFWGGTDYTLANAAITLPNYSHQTCPFGFNTDPNKWIVRVTDTTDRTQASPSSGTWYNLGTTAEQITLPIGIWDVSYQVTLHVDSSGAAALFATLSTANNTESDTELTCNMQATSSFVAGGTTGKRKLISASSKTTYFLNSKTSASGVTTLYNRNSTSGAELIIEARFALL